MNLYNLQLPPNHQSILDQFMAACQSDERIVAALLIGSYANATADAHSDLDLCVITNDDAFDSFDAGKEDFVRRLGEPLFMDDFGTASYVLSILSNGTEVDLLIERESKLTHLLHGPYRILVDKKHLFEEVIPWRQQVKPEAEQLETLRRQVYWFWHDMVHFITAMSRGQLWWAYGQLEILRTCCVNLTRLQQDFSGPETGDEAYFKIDEVVALEHLAPLQPTFCPMEQGAMLEAAAIITRRYRELAPPLAEAHGIEYPAALDRLISERLEKLK